MTTATNIIHFPKSPVVPTFVPVTEPQVVVRISDDPRK